MKKPLLQQLAILLNSSTTSRAEGVLVQKAVLHSNVKLTPGEREEISQFSKLASSLNDCGVFLKVSTDRIGISYSGGSEETIAEGIDVYQSQEYVNASVNISERRVYMRPIEDWFDLITFLHEKAHIEFYEEENIDNRGVEDVLVKFHFLLRFMDAKKKPSKSEIIEIAEKNLFPSVD